MDCKNIKFILTKAKKLENNKKFLASSLFYKNALEIARDLGDSKKIKELKKKVTNINKKVLNNLNESTAEVEIEGETINQIKNIIDNDIKESLKRIGKSSLFEVDSRQVSKIAEGTMPVSLKIAGISTISKEGHLLKNGTKKEIFWEMKVYRIQQGIINIFLNELFKELNEKGLERKLFLEYLNNNSYFSSINLEIFAIGLKRYFSQDYVSALHILVPQFEAIFLKISKKNGIDILSLERGKKISTTYKTLSSYNLENKEFKEVWGVNFCNQLNFVLFRPLGYKLRHKIAHGQIEKKDCSLKMANLILYFYLVIATKD